MKRIFFVFLTILVVVFSYVGIYNYLKSGGVKILKDATRTIPKDSDFYLHYKVLNKNLLEKYGIDLRILIDKNVVSKEKFVKKELKSMVSQPRKPTPNTKAKKFVFVLIDPVEKTMILKSSSITFPNSIFKNVDKSSLESYVISIEEALLEYEWKSKK